METILIAKEGEYWEYENNCGSHSLYFHFNNEGSYDTYNRFIDRGFVLFNNDGDLLSGERSWSIVDDSILKWDKATYKIVSFTEKKIVLSYLNKQNHPCKILMIKVVGKKSGKVPVKK
ncbi:MAG: hypothetical protein ABI576_21170 [Flavobacterium sp.]